MTAPLPQSIEAEEAILGAMLRSPRAIDTAAALRLTAEHFQRPQHQVVFTACQELHAKGVEPDPLAVMYHLKGQGRLTEAGGFELIGALPDHCPAVANARAYAQEVLDVAVLRGLVRVGQEFERLGTERPDEPQALIAHAGALLDELTSSGRSHEVGISTAAAHLLPYAEAMGERRVSGRLLLGHSSGFGDIDARWGGVGRGHGGRLIVVAGRPGMGKSAWLGTVLEAVAFGSGADVYSVNLEMREAEQAGRLLARAGAIDLQRATTQMPTEQEVEAASTAAINLHEAASRLHWDESSNLSIDDLRNRARKLNRDLKRRGRRLELIGVDYLQLIDAPRGVKVDDVAKFTLVSRRLKSLALELGVDIIALSQLNREVEQRQPPRPRLSDLRGSGSIEQDADIVMFLFRPEYYLKDDVPNEIAGLAEAITAKYRNGMIGTDELLWEAERMRFAAWTGPRFFVGGAGR